MLLVRLGSNTDTTFWGKLHISSYNTWFCVHKLDWKLSFKYPVVSQKASETKRVTVGLMKLRWSQELEHFILVPEHQFSCQCLCLYMWSGQTVFPPSVLLFCLLYKALILFSSSITDPPAGWPVHTRIWNISGSVCLSQARADISLHCWWDNKQNPKRIKNCSASLISTSVFIYFQIICFHW